MAGAVAACRRSRRRPVPGGAEPQGRMDRAPVRRAPRSRGIGGRSRSPDRGGRRAAGSPANRRWHHRELKSAYTFESFVIGAGNRFAHAAGAGRRRAARPGLQPALPLRRAGRRQDPPRCRRSATTSTLCDRGLDGPLRDRRDLHERVHGRPPADQICPPSRSATASVDVLLLDDVQFLESKNKTAEEFFYTFDALINGGAQVVLSADRPPSAMPLLHSRLKDRFESGLLVDIAAPDPALRLAVLRKRAGRMPTSWPRNGVLDLLARRSLRRTSRSLESALIRSRAYASLTQQPLTLGLVEQVLDAAQPTRQGSATSRQHQPPSTRSSSAPRRVLGLPRSRPHVPQTQPSVGLCSPGRDVPVPGAHRPLAARHRPAIRWPRSHHRPPRAPQDPARAADRHIHARPCGQACGGPAAALDSSGQSDRSHHDPLARTAASHRPDSLPGSLQRARSQQISTATIFIYPRHDRTGSSADEVLC